MATETKQDAPVVTEIQPDMVAENPPADKPNKGLPNQAVFIGREVTATSRCRNPRIFTTNQYYDEDGLLIDFSKIKEGDEIPVIMATETNDFYPGDIIYLPVWKPELLEAALGTGEFAKVEAQKSIKAKHKAISELVDGPNGTGTMAQYRKLMKDYWKDLDAKGLVLKPSSGEFTPKEEKNG
jgi:hypothetical protein